MYQIIKQFESVFLLIVGERNKLHQLGSVKAHMKNLFYMYAKFVFVTEMYSYVIF